jgi:asparagine synthase (glutamine-hydrolysing)
VADLCGIAGFVDPTMPDLDGTLQRMLDCMVHRGPDGEGKYLAPELCLALGMRRLSIIDLEGGSQPIWNEDRTVCVIFNGEIYNYLELDRELRSKGHRFRTRSDTEVLVHLYEDLGEQMTSRLRGMFAFCIYDQRGQVLFFARDHFGQKPLYYTTGADQFAFASELKALLTLPWVSRELDRDAFLDFAAWLSLPAPRTHFCQIRKLPAGCSLRIQLDAPTAEATRYWHYDLSVEPDLTKLDSAVDELDRALTESVSLHLRADVPVGVLLSSGLDSRTILAYAQALQGGGVQSFSVGFGAEDSELTGAAQTARELRSQHHQLELTAFDFAEDLDRVVRLLDEPIGDPACFAVLRVCELAREHVKVLLSGEGSDEIFAGYEGRYAGMLTTMERTQQFRRLARFLPNARCHASGSRWQRFLARAHSSPGSEAVMLRVEALPGDVRMPRGLTCTQLEALVARTHALADSVFRPQRDNLSALLALDISWQLAESLLQKADKMSMGASVELRTPILDIEVAKVAARIPSSFKLPPSGPGKHVLRKVLSRKVNEPMDRPKKGFPLPLHGWFTGPLREQIEGELFATNSFIAARLNCRLLRAAWDDLITGWDGSRIFCALWVYERWCRAILQ